jgi:hypothetical protein
MVGWLCAFENVLDIMPMETDTIEFNVMLMEIGFSRHILMTMAGWIEYLVMKPGPIIIANKAAAHKKLQSESNRIPWRKWFATNGNDGRSCFKMHVEF